MNKYYHIIFVIILMCFLFFTLYKIVLITAILIIVFAGFVLGWYCYKIKYLIKQTLNKIRGE